MTTERMAEICCCSTGDISKLCQAGANGDKTGFIGAYKEKRRWVIPTHYFTFMQLLESKGNIKLSLRLYNIKRL